MWIWLIQCLLKAGIRNTPYVLHRRIHIRFVIKQCEQVLSEVNGAMFEVNMSIKYFLDIQVKRPTSVQIAPQEAEKPKFRCDTRIRDKHLPYHKKYDKATKMCQRNSICIYLFSIGCVLPA